MPMHNLIEYSSNYTEITTGFWFYSKDEATNFDSEIANNNLESFEYKTKLLGNIEADGNNVIKKKSNNCCAIKIFK